MSNLKFKGFKEFKGLRTQSQKWVSNTAGLRAEPTTELNCLSLSIYCQICKALDYYNDFNIKFPIYCAKIQIIYFLYQRTIEALYFVLSDIREKQPNIHPFSQLCPLYKQLLATQGAYTVSAQYNLPVIPPLGQEFQGSASLTNQSRKDLFSIVEFKNILNYICYSLFKAFFFPLAFLSCSLIFHCLILISLSFWISSSHSLFFVSSLFLAFLPAAGLWLEGVDAAAQPFSHSSLI